MKGLIARATFILLFFFSFTSQAQVMLNEVQTSNGLTIADEHADYNDWIEIYNASGSTLNLSGYQLSDRRDQLNKFVFGSTAAINPNSRMLIFCGDSSVNTFSYKYETAVYADDIWKYRNNTTAPTDTNWRNLSFNDASWTSGTGGIGWSDGDDGTIVTKSISVYMRKTFTVSDTSRILGAVLTLDYDDAHAIYLNGVEIKRRNLSGAAPSRPNWNDASLSSHEANKYRFKEFDWFEFPATYIKSLLKPGTNVLAYEVHNVSSTDGDLTSLAWLTLKVNTTGSAMFGAPPAFISTRYPNPVYYHAGFKIDRAGETVYLANLSNTIIDSIATGAMDVDQSIARNGDGNSQWCYTTTPTPNAANSNGVCATTFATIPVFSIQGGFYSSAQTLSLSTTWPGGQIRYTIDGSMPKATSALYSSPLSLSTTTTVRACVFASGAMPSTVITNTFLISFNCVLPVIAVTTDSLNLYDNNYGIWVTGNVGATDFPYFGSHLWEDWERPVAIEIFDKSKNRAARFNAEIALAGGWSRAASQKSSEIKLSDKYGLSDVNYSFMSDKPWIDKWDNFMLNTSGNDRDLCHMRDPLMERLLHNTNNDYVTYEPCIMLLNGKNWGTYYFRENDDNHWIKLNYGYKSDEIDLLKESYFAPDIEVKRGSDTAFYSMYSYCKNTSATNTSFYSTMDSLLDLKNMIDYFAAETFYPNDDWMGGTNNNLKLWRPRKAGGKFRYICYDLDFGLGYSGSVTLNMLNTALYANPQNYQSELFYKLCQNPVFKNYFINRYADLMNTIFLPSSINAMVDTFTNQLKYDQHLWFEKWGGDSTLWRVRIDDMKGFANARPANVRNQIQTEFAMTGQVTLTLNVTPANAGRIVISTITPGPFPWKGVYFNGNPVTITAIPNPGYTFNHWWSSNALSATNNNQSVNLNFTTNDSIVAYFTGSPITANISFSEINYNSANGSDAGDWIELKNSSASSIDLSNWIFKDDADQHQYSIPVGTVIPANGYLVLASDITAFKSIHPTVTNVIGSFNFDFSNGGEMLRLFDYNNVLHRSVLYDDIAPWPLEADGNGYTLEIINQSGDLNDGNNWMKGCLNGSPGRAFSLPVATASAQGNTTICPGSNVILNANNLASSTYQWFKNNSSISGATSLNYSATDSGSYTVSITNSGCTNTSASIQVTASAVPSQPIASDVSRCGSGSVTLTATASDTLKWYDAPNGNLLFTGNNFVTSSLSTTTTYYVLAKGLCSSPYTSVQAVINPVTNDPSTISAVRCGTGSVSLSASGTNPLKWYNTINGTLLFTGATYITPNLSSSTTYYVQAGSACPSNFIAVNATIDAVTPDPVTTSASRCGTGTVTLTATGTNPLKWYDAPNGNLVFAGTSFTTPTLSSTTNYYVQAGTTCPSAYINAQAIIGTVASNPTAADVSRCNSGSVTLTASGSTPLEWYNTPGGTLLSTGSTFTTPVISSSTSYYVRVGGSCASNYTTVQAIINTSEPDPVTTSSSRCGSGTLTLSATGTSPLKWYDAPNGNLLFTGSSFTTPSLSSSINYYVQAGSSCLSNFAPVTATIQSITPDAATTSSSRCGSGTVTLSATGTSPLKWYDAPNGNLLFTGSSFNTPSLSSTTNYYVQAGSVCPGNFVSAQAIINTVTPDPTTANQSRCGNGSVTLTASGTSPVKWYDAPNGNLLFTGNNYNTPSISISTNYYVQAGSLCPSNFITAQAIINSVSNNPASTSQSRCGNGSLTLNATGDNPLKWFDAPNGNLLFTGASFITPSLSSTTNYFIQAGSTCPSGFTSVQAIVNSIPAAPASSDVQRCGSGSVSLTASASGTIQWLDAPNGNILATGTTFTTPSLMATTTYYLRTVGACTSAVASVQAIIGSVSSNPVAPNVARCNSGSVTLTATGSSPIEWYDAPSGTLLATGSTFITPVISNTTSYYVRVGGSCASGYTTVQAQVNAAAQDPSPYSVERCGSGNVVLSASGTSPLEWFVVQGGSVIYSGDSLSVAGLTATTTYYVRSAGTCPSNYIPVTATINTVTPDPAVQNEMRCDAGLITLSATSDSIVNWYDAIGGTLLHSGNTFTTSISASTTFYVQAGTQCPSGFAQALAEVITSENNPIVTDDQHCGSASLTLSAQGNNIAWFDTIGGSQIATGNSFITPVISQSTTFFVQSVSICPSSFVAANAIINAISADPVLSGIGACGSGQITLIANAQEQVQWFDAQSGGNLLFTGDVFTTPVLNTTTTYYASSGTICPSSIVSIDAEIYNIPTIYLGSDTIIAVGNSVTLNAGNGYSHYNWSTGDTSQTISVNSSATYYVTVTDGNGCNGTDSIEVMVSTYVPNYSLTTSVIIFPNPVTDVLTIAARSNDDKILTIELLAMNGQIVKRIEPADQPHHYLLKTEDVAKGNYLLRLKTNRGVSTFNINCQ